ncbi:hypothetical protein [Pseudomonas sp. LP23]|uniref:hypothetical protein n=1 Tax=Pseudomonas sp. LP23 TaxID=3029195 RepID=UPI001DAD6D2F|nr:hypothetical protein [Pseudomonas aeruginosa]
MEHLFKQKKVVHDVVISSDNIEMECLYQGHPYYSALNPLCQALHLVFLKYAPTRARGTASTIRRAIWIFLDFAQDYNSTRPLLLQIYTIADISAEVFKAFEGYLFANDHRIDNSTFLKAALNNAALLTEAIPALMLPHSTRPANQSRIPLNDEADAALEQAFKSHTDALYKKLEFRELVHKAKPYTFEEVQGVITGEYSRANIFQWMQYCQENKIPIKTKRLIPYASKSSDAVLRLYSSYPNAREKIFSEYNYRGDKFRFVSPKNPFDTPGSTSSLINFKPDLIRTIKTLITNGYPFSTSLPKLGERYAFNKSTLSSCEDVVQLLIHRWSRDTKCPEPERLPLWDDVLEMYYPSMLDMSCIVQFMMLQTNWNKETVLALDPENFEHPLTGATSDEYVIIHSEKNRGQGIGKPYHAPKPIIAASTRSDKYSAWNLFRLAIELSRPLKNHEFDYIKSNLTREDYNLGFLCIRYYADWVNKGGRHTSMTNEKAALQGAKQFLKKYEVLEDGKRLTSASDITMRLRSTWVKRRKAAGDTSHGYLALFLGHSSKSTTDIHYDNSPVAQAERYDRLESELEAILALMYEGKFDGMLGTPAQEAVNLPLKVFHIPGMEKPLWACINQTQPKWPGAATRVEPGKKCYVVSKCVFCSQCFMFEDSLPYLMERRIHVTELIDDLPATSSDYSSEYEIELAKIDSILDNWEDDQAIKEAARYQRRNSPLLPRDLNFLQVIFEEEDK